MKPARDQVLGAYQATGAHLKRSGQEWHGPCPACGGTDRFWVKQDGAFGCRQCQPGATGAGKDAYLAILQALGLIDDEETECYSKSPEPKQAYGCTMAQLAERTALPIELLRGPRLRWTDSTCYVQQADGEVPSVRMPYPDGMAKHRVAIEGRDKYRYEKGSTAALYGIECLAGQRVGETRRVVVVEGETDRATAELYDIACLGVPGTSSVKVIEGQHLEGITEMFVIQEPDDAGKKFPVSVEARVREIGSSASVIPVVLPAKDLNELHKADPRLFRRRFQAAAKAARERSGLLEWTPTSVAVNSPLLPIPWVCYPILRPGLGLLWAPSFAGKSTLLMQICDAAARGDRALGLLQCRKVGVRFVGYELGTKEDQRRMWAHVGVPPKSHDGVDFQVITDFPRADKGGVEALDRMLLSNPGVQLLVIDTLARFWGMGKKKTSANAYYQESEALGEIEVLARNHPHLCLMMITHSTASKLKVSGTEAMRGIPRTLVHLDRPDGDEPAATLSISHNGAPGSRFSLTSRDGSGWRVDDGSFQATYLSTRHEPAGWGEAN